MDSLLLLILGLAVIATPFVAIAALVGVNQLRRKIADLEQNLRTATRELGRLRRHIGDRPSTAPDADASEAAKAEARRPPASGARRAAASGRPAAPEPREVAGDAAVTPAEPASPADRPPVGARAAPPIGGPTAPTPDTAVPITHETPGPSERASRDGAEKGGSQEEAAGRAPATGPARSSTAVADFETRVGTTWTMRVGLVVLAIAFALFARSIVPTLSAGVKVAMAYAGAIGLFAVGRVFERKLERFARPVMAGGLAFGFFVSFASYFVPAMRAVPLAIALAWMAASVLAVLLAAERWQSQPTAGLAIFLGHVAAFVAAGDADVYSLVIIAFLSLTAVMLLVRHEWVPLSLFAVVAAYASHLLWGLAEHPPAPPNRALLLNLLFLSSYYGIFIAADLIWWRRLNTRLHDEYSRAQKSTGRLLGPVNLTLYVSLVSFVYVALGVQLANIEWFFFGLAAVQGILTFVYRGFGNKDYVFYPALGAIIATAGVFAAFETLTLNLVLASEALILLFAAHRTRLWFFHLLAQAALALNFFHYWIFARPDEITLPLFLGGMMVVLAYMVKASLEEIWYGGRAYIEWEGGADQTRLSMRLVEMFDRFYSPIAPQLSRIHAAAGAVILIHQSYGYFTPNTALGFVAGALVVAVAVAFVRRSVAMLVAYIVLQAGLFAIATSAGGGAVDAWTLWGVTTAGLAASAVIAWVAPNRLRAAGDIAIALVVSQLAAWVGLGLAAYAVSPDAATTTFALYLPWVVAIGLVYVNQHRSFHAFASIASTADARKAFDMVSTAGGVAASFVTVHVTARIVGTVVAAPVWVVGWSTLLLVAAGLVRGVRLYLAGFVLLMSSYAYSLLDQSLTVPVIETGWAATVIVMLTLAIALAHDRSLGHLEKDEHVWRELTAVLATVVIYSTGLALLTAFFDSRMAFPWSVAVTAVIPFALAAQWWPVKLPVAPAVGTVMVFGLQLVYLIRAIEMGSGATGFLIPALVFSIETIVFERMVTRIDWSEMRGRGIGSDARLPLVVAATAVAMSAAYQSDVLGSQWTTAGWSVIAATLMGLGFLLRSAIHRRVALAVFAVGLVRVFLVDTRDLSDTAKTLAFMILGICLVGVAWLYARYADEIKKWL